MSAPSKALVLALALVGFLLVGCAPPPANASTDACDYDYSRLMVPGWKFYKQIPLGATDASRDATTLCVVFHQVEVPRPNSERAGFPDQTPRIVPIMGSVHRKDLDRSPDIHQYHLTLPNNMFLGEYDVSARLEDVLSNSPGLELIVEDRNPDGVIVEASIFQWNERRNSEASSFDELGWFMSTAGIKIGKDSVITLNREPCCGWRPESRSQLAMLKMYKPNDNKDYHGTANGKVDLNRIKDPSTVGIVTLVMLPDDALAKAEYPEKLVLAFYERLPITDTNRLDPIMYRDAQAMYWNSNRNVKIAALGCLVDRNLKQAFVQSMNLDSSHGIPPHIQNENLSITDTVTVTSQCTFADGRQPKQAITTWQIQWDWDYQKQEGKWHIIKATTKSP